MVNLKYYLTLLFVVVYWATVRAQASNQALTIEACYSLARQNYPLIKQKALISKTREYSVANVATGNLPQVSFSGQATYQSDVTQIPIKLPNQEMPTLSKDQYRVTGEVSQVLYNGGLRKSQEALLDVTASVEDQKVEVELYKIKERINQLFFGVLLIEEQLKQIELLQKDILSGINKVRAAVANGTAFKSSATILQAELLKINQRRIELISTRESYLNMLGLFINKEIPVNTLLEKPQEKTITNSINRPELKLYDLQQRGLESQDNLRMAKNRPRVGLFWQGGYGRPGLNLLNNDFDFFYIGGIRLNWTLAGWYTDRNDRELLTINRQAITVQQETFLFNTNLALKGQISEVTKLLTLIDSDKEIIALRQTIKNTAKAQLENGVITSHDYLTEVNAEDQARQTFLMHQVQLLLAQYTYQTTSGN